MRILHFSDPHLDPDLSGVPMSEWPGKRLIGAANLLLNRRKHFDRVEEKLAALDRFRQEQNVDLVLCTGDYSVLGTEGELKRAREVIQPLTGAPQGFITIPGNHDLYMPDTVKDQRFERIFGDLMGEGDWPRVRRFGDDIAVIGIESARPNPQPWRSSGQIPEQQLERLARTLVLPDMERRFVFVMTHYAPRLWNGHPDSPAHGMTNAEEFLEACSAIRQGAILCGHVHSRYRVEVSGLQPQIFCAGSVSQNRREGLWLFDIDGGSANAVPGRWNEDRYELEADQAYGF
ncbi:MAG: metallophosphoesterase [Acidobacteria bacterium]|uniref:Metallophosphoesterase n=1 Tax=Candidatus Polarisedimenticola svalbardensis TaxID=2886004 RepID=A0A8J6XXW0_9BACT|nr:metallophosphoesterase [Candidatus Polarisedimenticola svalbardensis]